MNPPFSLLSKVVQRIKSDHAHGIIIVPDWGYTKWYKELLPFWKRDVLFEKGCKVFELGGKICNGTRWPTRAILFDPRSPHCSKPQTKPTSKVYKKDCMVTSSSSTPKSIRVSYVDSTAKPQSPCFFAGKGGWTTFRFKMVSKWFVWTGTPGSRPKFAKMCFFGSTGRSSSRESLT